MAAENGKRIAPPGTQLFLGPLLVEPESNRVRDRGTSRAPIYLASLIWAGRPTDARGRLRDDLLADAEFSDINLGWDVEPDQGLTPWLH